MIISENSECYRMISQNDHGDLAGQFATHWGNDETPGFRPRLMNVRPEEDTQLSVQLAKK